VTPSPGTGENPTIINVYRPWDDGTGPEAVKGAISLSLSLSLRPMLDKVATLLYSAAAAEFAALP